MTTVIENISLCTPYERIEKAEIRIEKGRIAYSGPKKRGPKAGRKAGLERVDGHQDLRRLEDGSERGVSARVLAQDEHRGDEETLQPGHVRRAPDCQEYSNLAVSSGS